MPIAMATGGPAGALPRALFKLFLSSSLPRNESLGDPMSTDVPHRSLRHQYSAGIYAMATGSFSGDENKSSGEVSPALRKSN
jgi:hypothetical protein